jgi:hypothetical protein
MNLGSAGGQTRQSLGSLATIRYVWMLRDRE